MRISVSDLREIKFLKYYRLVRKWAAKSNGLTEPDLELLIYLDALDRFSRKDFIDGAYIYTWDKHRWSRFKRDGWIVVWRQGNRKGREHSIYTSSFKTKMLITRIYKILLGEEDIPTSRVNAFYENRTYTDKVVNKAMDDMLKDKDR
jgi:hypothetical protein